MRCVVQRVTEAAVTVAGETVGRIGPGLVVLLGVAAGDTPDDARYMAAKVAKLRIFEDEQGKMNRSILDTGGAILAVSQFTLLGDARGQNRPGFTAAEAPELADKRYQQVCALWRDMGIAVQTGRFRAHMRVSLANDGPVTLLLDSRKAF